MDESHESSQSHVGQPNHSHEFPPYYLEQTTQSTVPSGPRFIHPYGVATLEQGPVEIFRAPNDDQIYDSVEYATEYPRQRLYSPPTPPLTPQKSQLSRGYNPACYRDPPHAAFLETTVREVPRRESWPQSHQSTTTPLYVETSPIPWSEQRVLLRCHGGPMEEEEVRYRRMEMRRGVERYHGDQGDDLTPIALQDPPKTKLKRQLSEDGTDIRPPSVTSYENKNAPPPSPRPSHCAPRTPQPESAHKVFSFNYQAGNMSPKRVKTECGAPGLFPSSSPASSSFQTDRGQTVCYQDDVSGNRSPKRVKADNGLARPPMSQLVQGEINQSYWSNGHQGRSGMPLSQNETSVFQFPDVSDPRVYEASDQMPPHSRYATQTVYQQTGTKAPNTRCIPRYPTQDVYQTDARVVQQEGCLQRAPSYPLVCSGDCIHQFSRKPQAVRPNPQRCLTLENHSPEKLQRLPSFNTEVYTNQYPSWRCGEALHMTCSPLSKRQQPLRSQSNVEHSPNKQELEEMEKEKYLRSLSKPDGNKDLLKLQRQMMYTRRAGNIHELAPFSENSIHSHLTGCIPELGARQPENRSVCRQLFRMRESESREQSSIERQPDVGYHIDATGRRHGMLIQSFDDCDIYMIPRASWSDTMTSHPDSSVTESEPVYHLQPRRHTISSSQNVVRTCSPMKGRSSPGKKRPKGEVNIRMNCLDVANDEREFSEKIQQTQQTSISCTCESVQAEILNIAKTAYTKAMREDSSREEFERSQRETREVNAMLRDALATARALKELCGHHRKINDIYSGSVVIAMQCLTLASLENLREMYRNGELKQFLHRNFITERLKNKYGVKYVLMSVTIDDGDFDRCKKELESSFFDPSLPLKKKTQMPKLSPLKRETKSVEDLENIPSCPQSPVHMRSCISTPVLMTSSPLSSPSYNAKSPSTPTKRERIFSFSNVDQNRRGKGRSSTHYRKYSLTSPGDISPRRVFQPLNTEEPPHSPSKKNFTIVENEAYREQSSPRLRKSLEDITSDMANVSVQR